MTEDAWRSKILLQEKESFYPNFLFVTSVKKLTNMKHGFTSPFSIGIIHHGFTSPFSIGIIHLT